MTGRRQSAPLCVHCSAMNRIELAQSVRRIGKIGFSRSSGPGGQHVNKVNSRVTLHVAVDGLGLSESERDRVRRRLRRRINREGDLVVESGETRSATRNRETVYLRATDLIDRARRIERPRRATKPTTASRERRLRSKRLKGQHKRARQAPNDFERY